jgi:hypothetical protein
MRGHALGPFDIQSNLRVQNVMILTQDAPTKQVYIDASEENPVLLTITPHVDTVASGGTNTLIVGTSDNDDAYYASGDVDPEAAGFGTVKKFCVTTAGYLVAVLGTVAIAASKVLTATLITVANTQTVVIGGQTYTFNTSLTNTANNVLIGADTTAMMLNLSRAINGGAGAGTLYGTGTVANASVSATVSTNTLTATALVAGTSGNSIAISETLTNSAWAGGATTLSGGEAGSTVGQVTLFLDA